MIGTFTEHVISSARRPDGVDGASATPIDRASKRSRFILDKAVQITYYRLYRSPRNPMLPEEVRSFFWPSHRDALVAVSCVL